MPANTPACTRRAIRLPAGRHVPDWRPEAGQVRTALAALPGAEAVR
jgi:hypothetical protein